MILCLIVVQKRGLHAPQREQTVVTASRRHGARPARHDTPRHRIPANAMTVK
jgi:hypothetical protein